MKGTQRTPKPTNGNRLGTDPISSEGAADAWSAYFNEIVALAEAANFVERELDRMCEEAIRLNAGEGQTGSKA